MPVSVERMRAGATSRDATLFSVMAYAGLRPGEALALRWGDIRENTLLIERAVSLGTTEDTKTTQHRTVRVLQPLGTDLLSFTLASGHPGPDSLVFPGHDGREWTEPPTSPGAGGPSTPRVTRPA